MSWEREFDYQHHPYAISLSGMGMPDQRGDNDNRRYTIMRPCVVARELHRGRREFSATEGQTLVLRAQCDCFFVGANKWRGVRIVSKISGQVWWLSIMHGVISTDQQYIVRFGAILVRSKSLSDAPSLN